MALRAALRNSSRALEAPIRSPRHLSGTLARHFARISFASPPPLPVIPLGESLLQTEAQPYELAQEPLNDSCDSFPSRGQAVPSHRSQWSQLSPGHAALGSSLLQGDSSRDTATGTSTLTATSSSVGFPGDGLFLECDSFSPYKWKPGGNASQAVTWRQLHARSQWSTIFNPDGQASQATQVSGSGTNGSGNKNPAGGRDDAGGAHSTVLTRNPYTSSSEPPQVRQLVITACGPDRPGLVSALSKRILEKGGNVEQSRMARLAGEFSIIMLATVDAAVPRIAEDLKASLMEVAGLLITTRWAQVEAPVPKKPRRKFRKIFLRGADNPGLVYNVTEYLAGKKINIENLETSTEEAPFGGTTLFTMEGVIAMPASMPTLTLMRSLEVLQDSLGVMIELHNMDPGKKAEDMETWRDQSRQVGGASRYSILAQNEGARPRKGDVLI